MTNSMKKFPRIVILFILLIDIVAPATNEFASKNETESVLSKFLKGKKQAKIMEKLVSFLFRNYANVIQLGIER